MDTYAVDLAAVMDALDLRDATLFVFSTGGGGPAPPPAPGIDVTPFLRYRLAVVAGPDHVLAGAHEVPLERLVAERRLVGPAGAEPHSALDGSSGRTGCRRRRRERSPPRNPCAPGRARNAARRHVARGDAARPPLPGGRRAAQVRDHAGRHAGHRHPAGRRPAARFRPPVYVTIWSAIEKG